MSEISVQRRFYAGSDASQRGLVVEMTVLRGAYMFYVAACASEEEMDSAVEMGRLGRDWACAMPPLKNGEGSGTSLFRSTANDAALSMGMRLAKRLESQVFVGLDVEGLEALRAEKCIQQLVSM
ncbi:Protein kinase [Mycena kentingensis (nom. inval.)]|nr:Protein kinase [Mycena kentingensis (nom. inval.)]